MESQCDRHRNTPFTEDSGKNRPSLCWRPWGSIEPELFYQTNRKMSTKGSHLTNPGGSGIIKITQGPATSGFASDYALVTKKSKPSLGRVAVSACNADRHRKTKKVKRDRYRHIHPPFRETKPPIAVLGPQGFHRTGYILPNKSKNVNKCSPLVKGEHLLYTYLFTHTHTSPGRRLRRRRWRILCRRGA